MALNKTNIEWCDLTWNPVVGCLHNCKDANGKPYCYADKLHTMRHKAYMQGKLQNFPQYAKPFKEPQFFKNRLNEPFKLRKPSTIFVVSMGDLFGTWIPNEWIEQVIHIATSNRQHKFMFLTKNPKRYLEFQFTENCWLGTTVEKWEEKDRVKQLMIASIRHPKCNKTFVSVEPLLSDMSNVDFTGINLVIAGADTSPGAKPPKSEWIESIFHDNIFYKSNIKRFM